MGLFGGPRIIITDNLHYYIDVLNNKCYPGSGTTVFDLSGNERTSTLENGTQVTDGVLVLDGSNDHVGYDYPSPFDWSATPWSVTYWVKITTDDTYPAVLDLMQKGNGHFRFETSNTRLECQFRPADGSISHLINYAYSFSVDTWYNCVFTRSGDNYTAYINGESVSTNTNSSLVLDDAMDVINIGYSADNDGTDRTFEGSIGPLFIHEKTLSDAEVLQNYNALKPRFT